MIGKYNPATTFFVDNKRHWEILCMDPNKMYYDDKTRLNAFGSTWQLEYPIKKELREKEIAYVMWGSPLLLNR